MRRLTLTLLGCCPLARARQPGFSIHEDLLAQPQFEVVFSDAYILERDAQHLLDPAAALADLTDTHVADPLQSPAPTLPEGTETEGPDGDGSEQISETYELVHVPPSRYLCAIPVLAPQPAANQTATDLAKAAEAKELQRASVRGAALLDGLAGECLYYISGWWSYSFCYGKDVVQFHALTTKAGLPVKDEHSQDYILGRMLDGPGTMRHHRRSKAKRDLDVQTPLDGGSDHSGNSGNSGSSGNSDNSDHNNKTPYGTELQVKGDQRYMVQQLGAGSVCDLTNRARTIEIQYHCNPGGTGDRINWIKEVTTCAYLMEVRTPRLCEEAAFLPPKPTRAHAIQCRRIVANEHLLDHDPADERTLPPGAGQAVPAGTGQSPLVIGGIAIGGYQTLGRGADGQAVELAPPLPGAEGAENGRLIQVIARAAASEAGGQIEMLHADELAVLDLQPQAVESLIETMKTIANGKAWKLEAYQVAGRAKPDIRAIIEEDEENEEGAEDGRDPNGEGDGDEAQNGGSQETFKDEL